MLTKNFYAMLSGSITRNKFIVNKASNGGISTPIDLFDANNSAEKHGCLFDKAMTNISLNIYDCGIVFSSSGSKPTAFDYVPKGNLRSDIEATFPPKISVNITENNMEVVSSFSVKNITPAVITLKSLWLVLCLYSTDAQTPFVVDHTLLETPITLQPGESKQITYTIRFNYPVAPV